jgi:hypothetical protein
MNGVQSSSPTTPFRLQPLTGEFLLVREADCSFAVFHREEIFSGLWLCYAQKSIGKQDPCEIRQHLLCAIGLLLISRGSTPVRRHQIFV